MDHISVASISSKDERRDHCYSTLKCQRDHPYASSGAKWKKDLGPIQDDLLKYVLDENRPPGELIVMQIKICLTREEFWSLGLRQFMDSNIREKSFTLRTYMLFPP